MYDSLKFVSWKTTILASNGFLFILNAVAADVLLWRNKKISAGVLASATAVWVIFEWLNYHFLTFVCLGLVLGLIVQFLWSNASGLFKR